jgi:hypothetical protein
LGGVVNVNGGASDVEYNNQQRFDRLLIQPSRLHLVHTIGMVLIVVVLWGSFLIAFVLMLVSFFIVHNFFSRIRRRPLNG